MASLETNTRKIVSRLENEGWLNYGGAKHDVYRHPDKKGRVVVPRHREQTIGVARSIARTAGWS